MKNTTQRIEPQQFVQNCVNIARMLNYEEVFINEENQSQGVNAPHFRNLEGALHYFGDLEDALNFLKQDSDFSRENFDKALKETGGLDVDDIDDIDAKIVFEVLKSNINADTENSVLTKNLLDKRNENNLAKEKINQLSELCNSEVIRLFNMLMEQAKKEFPTDVYEAYLKHACEVAKENFPADVDNADLKEEIKINLINSLIDTHYNGRSFLMAPDPKIIAKYQWEDKPPNDEKFPEVFKILQKIKAFQVLKTTLDPKETPSSTAIERFNNFQKQFVREETTLIKHRNSFSKFFSDAISAILKVFSKKQLDEKQPYQHHRFFQSKSEEACTQIRGALRPSNG